MQYRGLQGSFGLLLKNKAYRGYSYSTRSLWLSAVTGRQVELSIIFSMLLLLVVSGCTIGPSPFLVVGLGIGIVVCVGALLHPRFAVLMTFACAGLPSLLLPLPVHSAHLLEPPLLLCVLIVLLRRPDLQLRLPHLFAIGFVAISIISFIHVPRLLRTPIRLISGCSRWS